MCVCVRKRSIVFLYDIYFVDLFWARNREMWSNNVTSSRKKKNTLSCVYHCKSHAHTLERETAESFVCVRKGFVSVPGSRRVW